MQIYKNTKKPLLSKKGSQNTHSNYQAIHATIIQRAQTNPSSLTNAEIMMLHKTIGNSAVSRLLSGVSQRKSIDDKKLLNEPVIQRVVDIQGYESNIKPSEEDVEREEEYDKDNWVPNAAMADKMQEIYGRWSTNEANISVVEQLEGIEQSVGLYLINQAHKATLLGDTNRGNYSFLVNIYKGAERPAGDLLATLTHEVYLHLLPSLIGADIIDANRIEDYQDPHTSAESLPEGDHAPIIFPESFGFVYLNKQLSVFRGFLGEPEIAKAHLLKVIREIKSHVIGFRKKGFIAFRHWRQVQREGATVLNQFREAAMALDENDDVMTLLRQLEEAYQEKPVIEMQKGSNLKSLHGLHESPV